ncbi:MAG TPA: glycosyltransferase family 4 protein [Ktedonobacterales bacterium]|nr:glycosyltransferase family 4 protein [Ktedonobacterales bacterium]
MRIAMAHSQLTTFGGGERFVLEVSRRLASRHDVTLYTGTFLPEATYPGLADFPLVKVGAVDWARLRVPADAIVAHTFGANLLAFRNANVAYYVHTLRSIYLQGGKRPDLAARRALDRRAVRCDRRIIANSAYTAEKFQRLYHQPVTDQVYCGIDPLLFEVPEAVGEHALYLGRLAPEKGLERLLNWWQAIDYPLHIVGRGDPAYVEYLKLKAGKQVRFLAPVSGAEVAEAYRACRFVVYLPFEEELGIVPLEAMGAAKPVIVSNEGGLTETVQAGQTGFLVTSEAEFQAAARQLIASDDLCLTLGRAGRQRALPFTWERTAEQIERICAEMTAG